MHTCYLYDDFLVIRRELWEIKHGSDVRYSIYGLNGVCLSEKELPACDYEKVKKLIKRKKDNV